MKAAGLKRGMMDIDLFKKIVDDLSEFDDKLKKLRLEIMANQLYILNFLK